MAKSYGQTIEDEIQAKGKTAPRVTLADIEAAIDAEYYFTGADGARGASHSEGQSIRDLKWEDSSLNPAVAKRLNAISLLTFCVLVLKNGFTVTGESAYASPENFDADLGRKIARQNAVAKIRPIGVAAMAHSEPA